MGQFDGRRLSWVRVLLLLGSVAAIAFASMSGLRWFQDSQAARGEIWFAGYVDVTVTPRYDFEDPASPEGRHVALSFVVADPGSPCEPSWGGAYTLNDAALDLDLDRRLARLRQQGGVAVVSFGGAANTELAVTCTDEDDLYDAYRDVVDRYDVRTIDVDIEGTALADEAANERRARVLERLQESDDVRVWLTVPVAPTGLTEDALSLVEATLAADVDLAGVNLMTMNYGAGEPATSMADRSIAGLIRAHDQLGALYEAAGVPHGSAAMWRRMGATPMIGQNDVAGEIFTLADARELNEFALEKGLGRLSLWSLNRDWACGSNYPDVAIVSNSCSGIRQDAAAFARMLAVDADGQPDVVLADPPEPDPTAVPSDDPDNSPYPIWDADEVYLADSRVVWHRNVFVANWWTQGDVPDDPLVEQAASPWALLGPVLPGETPIPTPTLAPGTYPQWNKDRVYRQGDRVQVNGVPFVAQWYSEGEDPLAPSTQESPSSWRTLTDQELRTAVQATRG